MTNFIFRYLVFILLGHGVWTNAEVAEWASSNMGTLPLAVRSPYLNLWLDEKGLRSDVGENFPRLWNKDMSGWTCIVRVDGKAYWWTGDKTPKTEIGSIRTTPTRTIFSTVAGPVQFNITYLSPIEPSDWVKQSFPFSYVSIDAFSTDGLKHDVQLYTDITGELLTDDPAAEIQFKATVNSQSIFHSIQRTAQSSFQEAFDEPKDGILYLAAPKKPGLTWQTGSCKDLRKSFLAKGTLKNSEDTKRIRQLRDGDYWVCVSLSIDLGNITATTSPGLWALGLVRDASIQATSASGTESRSPLFHARYSSDENAIDDFLLDFGEATKRALALDRRVMDDGTAISTLYTDLLAFSSRLAFGALEITVPSTTNKEFEGMDIKVYMKDLGNSSRANAVDVLFSAFPAYLYFNANLTGVLLEPLLNLQSLSTPAMNYSAADLGSKFPSATGGTPDSRFGLEASGSMLIMALAHARKSGDGRLCQRYYNLLKSWADFLSANGLEIAYLITSDGNVPPGDTNLALKAIIGVQAMSAINKFLEPQGASPSDTSLYANKARSMMLQWKNMTMPTDYIRGTFNDLSSWGLLYNAYADKLLRTGLIETEVYKVQSAQYATQMITAPAYGFQYHSHVQQARSDWTLLTAAAVSDTSVRDYLLSSVHKSAVFRRGHQPWPTLYDANNASAIAGLSSPGHGASFALLSLNLPDQTIRLDPSIKVPGSSPQQRVVGPLAGGVIGGSIFLALVIVGLVWYRRRQVALRQEAHNNSVAVPYDPYSHDRNTSTATNPSAIISQRRSRIQPRSKGTEGRIGATGPSTASGLPVPGLRNEVEQLRREVAMLMQETSPPGYADQGQPG